MLHDWWGRPAKGCVAVLPLAAPGQPPLLPAWPASKGEEVEKGEGLVSGWGEGLLSADEKGWVGMAKGRDRNGRDGWLVMVDRAGHRWQKGLAVPGGERVRQLEQKRRAGLSWIGWLLEAQCVAWLRGAAADLGWDQSLPLPQTCVAPFLSTGSLKPPFNVTFETNHFPE
jgi:hypothetical protein